MNTFIQTMLSVMISADNPLSDLYSFDTVWLPSKYMAKEATMIMMESAIDKVFSRIGIAFLAILTMARFAKLILTAKGYTIGVIVKNMIPPVIVGAIIATSGTWAILCQDIVLKSAEALITAVKDACLKETFQSFVDALAASSAVNLSIGQQLASMIQGSVSIIIFTVTNVLALCIAWAMNLYIALMWSLLFIIGPALLPFVVFENTANIGWVWIKSFLAFSFMGVVGAIIQGLLFGVGLLTFAGSTATEGDLISGIASSLVFLICMAMVPSITSQMTGGISGSPMAIASSLIPAASAVASSVTGVGGIAAGYAAGAASRVAASSGRENLAGALKGFGEAAKARGARSIKKAVKTKL
jgi:hypothetical protein